MIMIEVRPRPGPPLLEIYPHDQRADIQRRYEEDLNAYFRETRRNGIAGGVVVLMAGLSLVAFAISWPLFFLKFIEIIAK